MTVPLYVSWLTGGSNLLSYIGDKDKRQTNEQSADFEEEEKEGGERRKEEDEKRGGAGKREENTHTHTHTHRV